MGNEAKVVSVTFAMSAFVVALIAGLAAGNSPFQVLVRALVAMFVCQVIGTLAGEVVARIVREHEERYREANPVPLIPAISSARKDTVVDVDEVVDESGKVRRAA